MIMTSGVILIIYVTMPMICKHNRNNNRMLFLLELRIGMRQSIHLCAYLQKIYLNAGGDFYLL